MKLDCFLENIFSGVLEGKSGMRITLLVTFMSVAQSSLKLNWILYRKGEQISKFCCSHRQILKSPFWLACL